MLIVVIMLAVIAAAVFWYTMKNVTDTQSDSNRQLSYTMGIMSSEYMQAQTEKRLQDLASEKAELADGIFLRFRTAVSTVAEVVKHELRRGRTSFWIWTASIGFLLAICIFIFPEMKGEMEGINDVFSSMGSFTAAFGMDRLNFGSLVGYYAIGCAMGLIGIIAAYMYYPKKDIH